MRNFSCYLFSIFSIICVQISFGGCSDSVPNITDVTTSVIYEYNSLQESPSQKLSVFVQSSPDTARVENIIVIHPEEKIQWEITSPLILNNDSKVWTGSANLMSPYYGPIPQGKYTITYTDLAGKESISNFVLEYKEIENISLDEPIFLDSSAMDDSSSQNNEPSEPIKKFAIYSEENGMGSLLFYDEKWDNWQSFDDIIDSYSEAKSLRICLDFPSNKVRYLLPFHNFN